MKTMITVILILIVLAAYVIVRSGARKVAPMPRIDPPAEKD